MKVKVDVEVVCEFLVLIGFCFFEFIVDKILGFVGVFA